MNRDEFLASLPEAQSLPSPLAILEDFFYAVAHDDTLPVGLNVEAGVAYNRLTGKEA